MATTTSSSWQSYIPLSEKRPPGTPTGRSTFGQMPACASPVQEPDECKQLAADLHNAFALFGGSDSPVQSSRASSRTNSANSSTGCLSESDAGHHNKPLGVYAGGRRRRQNGLSRFARKDGQGKSVALPAALEGLVKSEADVMKRGRDAARQVIALHGRPPRSPSWPGETSPSLQRLNSRVTRANAKRKLLL